MSWTYVKNELDEAYSKPLPNSEFLESSDLPESEFLMREWLSAWAVESIIPYLNQSLISRLIKSEEYIKAKDKYHEAIEKLKIKIQMPENRSALKRIISVMPEGRIQKKLLLNTIIQTQKLEA